MAKKRKPNHPGKVLNELYIQPLQLNVQKLADRLGIARDILVKMQAGKESISPEIARALAQAFDTTPQLWLNLQRHYDLFV